MARSRRSIVLFPMMIGLLLFALATWRFANRTAFADRRGHLANYRLRLRLHCGAAWQAHRTASLRGRSIRW